MDAQDVLIRLDRFAVVARGMLPCVAIALGACGAQATHEVASTPHHYQGSCEVAGIDEVAAPAEQRGDSLALVVRHRFGEGTAAAGEQPLTVRSELARSRENDPQLQLEGHSTVVCNPDSHAAPIEPPANDDEVR